MAATLRGRLMVFEDANIRAQVRAAWLKEQGYAITFGAPIGAWAGLDADDFIDDLMKAVAYDPAIVEDWEADYAAYQAANPGTGVDTTGFVPDATIEALVVSRQAALIALHGT